MKLKYFLFVAFIIISNFRVFSQEKEYKLDEVIVSANRVPIEYANLARTVTVITNDEIKNLPVNNVQDLLEYINAIDLKTRGSEGVQADAGIRGGTFEQTLIMIDGIKISDPQTGHHNLNLPITLNNIERIEILKGQGSRLFGANAFGGAINIITKKSNKKSLSLSGLAGEHNLYELNLFSSYPIGITGNNFSVSRKKSNGYRENTDFDITTFSIGQNLNFRKSVVNFFFGYVDKKFGAYNFYSDRFPNQWEHTTTKLFSTSAEFGNNNLTLSPKIFWRRNDDDYILDKKNPDWYHNIHKTYSYGFEVQASLKSSIGITSIGTEITKDEIKSSNLGYHKRSRGGIFAEQLINFSNDISLSAGIFIYNYTSIGWKFWPGIDLSYKISKTSKIFASYGKAFRIPTFTELYYTSPANMGNPNLKHEETTNYEFGFSYFGKAFNSGIALFIKDGNNIIDWGRLSKDSPWIVENLANVKTYGTEINLQIYPAKINSGIPVNKIEINYTYLSMDRTTGKYESKYLLDYLRHQLILGIGYNLPFNINHNWFFRFEERINFSPYWIVDSQISKQLNRFFLFIRGTNIFNKSRSDFAGLPLPGRWISFGVNYNL
ncbi:TonB-dependent receptor plug domain-containing protein [Rosettibacter firmus]|uniref:TonB-dependent receptor plug domain-containing protein n=1 Tax=Rosettibacter firmus TaxID=3111522 RepID=UPI00336C02B7